MLHAATAEIAISTATVIRLSRAGPQDVFSQTETVKPIHLVELRIGGILKECVRLMKCHERTFVVYWRFMNKTAWN